MTVAWPASTLRSASDHETAANASTINTIPTNAGNRGDFLKKTERMTLFLPNGPLYGLLVTAPDFPTEPFPGSA